MPDRPPTKADQALLLLALWRGKARLEPATHEIACGGLLYSVSTFNGVPAISGELRQALVNELTEGQADV